MTITMTLTECDQHIINQFYTEIDMAFDQFAFEYELELSNLQPNTVYGLFVPNQIHRYEMATIIEDMKDEYYLVGKFSNGEQIYIPAKQYTYNTNLNIGDEFLVNAYSTPGLVYPWRSKKCKIVDTDVSFDIQYNNSDAIAIIIGKGGCNINQIRTNCIANPQINMPKIVITNYNNYKSKITITGENPYINIGIIKNNINYLLNNHNIICDFSDN